MRSGLWVMLAVQLSPLASAATPGDSAAAGQRLHQANCTGCHDSSMYTRPNHKVRSLDALEHQVEGCGRAAKKEFSATEIRDLVTYLNESYYHFK